MYRVYKMYTPCPIIEHVTSTLVDIYKSKSKCVV